MTRQKAVLYAQSLGWVTWGRFRKYEGKEYQCFRKKNKYIWIGHRFIEHSDLNFAEDFVVDEEETKEILRMT